MSLLRHPHCRLVEGEEQRLRQVRQKLEGGMGMSFFDKIKQGLTRTKQNIGHSFEQLFAGELDDDFYDLLEETLILSDMGVDTALEVSENLRKKAKEEKIKTAAEAREALKAILTEMLTVESGELDMTNRPAVCLFIGVNGVGKTTTIGKVAARLKGEGKKILLCAGDTFRAAAADQLTIWAERAGVDIIKQHEGADPAAVVFDALSAAKARKADMVLVDTAGRLHNKQNLMNELNKISRVIQRELPDASRETLLVLDATTGQNGLIQARQFKESAGLTGVVLTKLDGTAKGGIVVAIAKELGVPVKFIGVGEGVDDLMPFEPENFVEALL
ncbi:MAG: signal recognition particle-docking protein FtsY [Oscillospiraceae bacterium]|nr:signal recognition particle-docking protein FtsY [Oscillospiraceae bacterium]